MKTLLIASCLIALPTVSFAQAVAQQCGPHDSVKEFLATKYKEKIVAEGMLPGDAPALVEHYQSKNATEGRDQNTWTMVRTAMVNGEAISCIVASGTSWIVVDDWDPKA